MRRLLIVPLCLSAIVMLGVQLSGQPARKVVLPGAQWEIEAADFPSLQAAIDALPESGGIVRLPPGKFEIGQTLLIEKEDVLLIGAGTGTHIVNTNQEGLPALAVRPKDHATNAKSNLWRVQLANFRITGNEKSGHGILATRVNEIFVHGVTVSYHGQDGIRLDNCYEDPRICDSLITYNKQTGLALIGCHDIVVCGNQFEENLDALLCADGFNLCMSGNNLDDHLRHGVVIENTYGSVVSGNMIEECQGVGIVLDRDCYGITLSANVIAHEFTAGIELRDAHGCAVTGNSFPIVHNRALVIGPASARISVSGNAFTNTYIGEGKTRRPTAEDPAGGIVLEGTSDIAISGNTFSDLKTDALSLSGAPSRRVLFSNNVLTNVKPGDKGLVESQVKDNLQ